MLLLKFVHLGNRLKLVGVNRECRGIIEMDSHGESEATNCLDFKYDEPESTTKIDDRLMDRAIYKTGTVRERFYY